MSIIANLAIETNQKKKGASSTNQVRNKDSTTNRLYRVQTHHQPASNKRTELMISASQTSPGLENTI